MHPIIGKRCRVSGVLTRARPNISLLKKETVETLGDKYPYANVELPSLDKHGIFDILLYNKLCTSYQVLPTTIGHLILIFLVLFRTRRFLKLSNSIRILVLGHKLLTT